jgi:hypothetical protein
MMSRCRKWGVVGAAVCVLAAGAASGAERTVEPPPNAPAAAEWNAKDGRLRLRYHGGVIFDGTVSEPVGQ